MKHGEARRAAAGWTVRKRLAGVLAALMLCLSGMTSVSAFASNPDARLESVSEPIIGLLNQIFDVLIPVVGAVGAVYSVFLGIRFAKAEEPQEREKAKTHLKNAIIGFVLIFVLVVALRIAVPNLETWMDAATQAAKG